MEIQVMQAKVNEAVMAHGKEKVQVGINTAKAFANVYGNDFKFLVWKSYMLIVPKSVQNALDSIEKAELVFDFESGRTIVDRRGLVLNNEEIF